MKKLFILLLLLTVSMSKAQKAKLFLYDDKNTTPPLYSMGFAHGTFTATYLNTTDYHVLNIGTSGALQGQFSLHCVQDYIKFIVALWNYGDTSAHTSPRSITRRTDDITVPGLHIITVDSNPFIFIVDSEGAVWKLTKQQALDLVASLSAPQLFSWVDTCPDPNCTCVQH